MIKWVPYAFVRIILFFISGIVFCIYFPTVIPRFFSIALCTLLGLFYIGFYFLSRILQIKTFNPGVLGLVVVFVAGYAHLQYQTDSKLENHLLTESDDVRFYTIQLTTSPQKKANSWKAEAKLLTTYTDEWKTREGNILLYFSKDFFQKPFHYGDILLIKGSPQLLQRPANPGEFDYQKFLSYRNIFHQHFLRSGNVLLLKNDPPSRLMASAIKARLWADSTLRTHVRGEREQGIASALVLGVTDGLDNELLNAYAATGAMHVLAVSGLHISIIYMLLLTLLKPLKKIKYGEWILALISLIVLWGYSFVTGLSPSVLRAVTMFSFMAISKPMGRNTNIYNTMAASALFILLFDPYLIMSVGFQLSYLAVIGIVYLQPGLYKLWQPRQRLWDEIWKISCVSIAAQISTFALGLLYFHQFPNYFLLSNLLVIPGSFLVLIAGIGVLAIGFIGTLASGLGWVLTWLIKGLNIVVFSVEKIPFSLVENINVGVAQCWILMLIMICMTLLLQRKKISWLIAGMVAVIGYTTLQWDHYFKQVNQTKITVYNIKGHTAFDLIDNGQCVFVTDSVFQHEAGDIRFHIRPNRLIAGIGQVYSFDQILNRKIQGGRLLWWKNKVIAIAEDDSFQMALNVQLDLLVIANNAKVDIEAISHNVKQIVLDSSNSYYHSKSILNIAKDKKINIHAVLINGAFDVFTQHGSVI